MNDEGAVWRFGDLEVREGEPLPKPATVEQTWALLLILYARETQTCGFVEYVQRFMDAYEKIDAGDSDMVQKADPTELGLFKKVKTELETTGVPPHIQAAALTLPTSRKKATKDSRQMASPLPLPQIGWAGRVPVRLGSEDWKSLSGMILREARRRWGPRATVWSHRSPSPSGETCYIGIDKGDVIVQIASGPDWVAAFRYADRHITDWPDRPKFVIPDRGE